MFDRFFILAFVLSLGAHIAVAALPDPLAAAREEKESRIDVELLEPPAKETPAEPPKIVLPPPPQKTLRSADPEAVPAPSPQQVAALRQHARELSFGHGIAAPTVELAIPKTSFKAENLIREQDIEAFTKPDPALEQLVSKVFTPGALEAKKLLPRLDVQRLGRPALPRLRPAKPGPIPHGAIEPASETVTLPELTPPETISEGIEGPASERRVISKPDEPLRVQIEAASRLVLKFWVLPDGTVSNVIPQLKAEPELETAAIHYLRQWRFNPLPEDVPSEQQWGTITFRFQLR